MPQVPVYSSPTIAPNELPGVRQQTPYRMMQAAMAGPEEIAKAGQAITSLGAEQMRQITAEQITTNEARVKQHDADVMGDVQAVLYDPNSGYMSQKGKNAVDGYQSTVERLQKIATERSDQLDNPAQQQLAASTTQMRIQAAIAQAGQHNAQQINVYEKAAGDTRIKVAQDGAAQAFNPIADNGAANFDHDKPEANTAYQQYLQTIRSEANDQADRAGLTDPDLRKALVKDALGKAYMGTLAHLIDAKGATPSDMKVAQTYFDSVKGELSAEQQDKVRGVLEAGTIKNTALSLAIELKRSLPAGNNIANQEEQLDDMFKAGKINADVHAMALQHLRADNAQRRSEQVESDKSLIGTVWDLANKGGKMTDLSPSQLNYIKQRGLGSQIDNIFNRESAAQDDSKMYSDLARMSAEDPVGFTKMDLSTVSGSLSKAHWNHLVGIQTAISRQDVKAMEGNKLVHTTLMDAKANLVAAGFNMNPKPNTSEAKRLEAFETDLRDALTAAQEANDGKPLTREQARGIALGHLKDQALANTGYFGTSVGQTHKPVYQMTPEERAKPWVIPEGDRAQIKASLQRQGLPASEDNIQRAYKLNQGVR